TAPFGLTQPPISTLLLTEKRLADVLSNRASVNSKGAVSCRVWGAKSFSRNCGADGLTQKRATTTCSETSRPVEVDRPASWRSRRNLLPCGNPISLGRERVGRRRTLVKRRTPITWILLVRLGPIPLNPVALISLTLP